MLLDTVDACCPYCGEPITLIIDSSGGDQDYIEDCSVCCQPIQVHLRCDPVEITLRHQNET
ncbi:CPXCG motif-containing cysteine-rich protein [Simiduia agarivorans]|uniref:CPXCG motif-containing cysteine-rich protein n=1 Tax=Simiduia agarivorans TaxID=447471 RepID=UPI0002E71255|nr:CPXCG motif-containing cysteine-rich protein [Simiduia agarivorans]